MNKYFSVDKETGEEKCLVKYLQGNPKDYRYDGRDGSFKLGANPIIDEKGKVLKTFSLTPMAFRVFEENLFGRGRKENWIELFFIDEKNALSCIMFNGTSASSLQNLQREIFYEDLSLCDVKLTVSGVEKSNDKGKWSQAMFTAEPIAPEERQNLREVEEKLQPFCNDTLTDTAVYALSEGSCFQVHKNEMLQLEA